MHALYPNITVTLRAHESLKNYLTYVRSENSEAKNAPQFIATQDIKNSALNDYNLLVKHWLTINPPENPLLNLEQLPSDNGKIYTQLTPNGIRMSVMPDKKEIEEIRSYKNN